MPNYLASIIAAIFIALILGQDPKTWPILTLLIWFIVLFVLGILITWLALLAFED